MSCKIISKSFTPDLKTYRITLELPQDVFDEVKIGDEFHITKGAHKCDTPSALIVPSALANTSTDPAPAVS